MLSISEAMHFIYFMQSTFFVGNYISLKIVINFLDINLTVFMLNAKNTVFHNKSDFYKIYRLKDMSYKKITLSTLKENLIIYISHLFAL